MKTFFRLFFIIVFSFVSLVAQAGEISVLKNSFIQNKSQIIYIADLDCENSIVSSNTKNAEIIGISDKKELFFFGDLEKTSPQFKFINEFLAKNYNKTNLNFYNKSYLSLKNEICTRAP